MFDLRIEGGIARLTMNRPEARNAIPFSGWADLAGAAEDAVRAHARLLILDAVSGVAFSAGADIASFGAFHADPDARTAFRQAIRHGLDTLRDLPIPTIALIEGACYGAGVALALACDIRFATHDAQFAITPAKLGISYPQEDVHRLVTMVGSGQAARLLFGGQSISGMEAERIGLVDICMEAGLRVAVEEFADAVMANDAASVRTLKRGIGLAMSGVRQDDGQDRTFEELLGSESLAIRLASYRDRRK